MAGVLLFHGGHLSGGYLGVDLFFVLSGYLITLLLMTEWPRRNRIRLKNFWARRARRLFPALVIALVGVAIYAHFVAIPEELGGIRADGFGTLFYVANWHSILAGHTYFQAGLAPSPLEHTWSLAIEEQFYLVWPLLVVGLLKIRNRPSTILRAALVIAGVSVALMVGLHITGLVSDNSLYLGTHTRVAAIAMGAALAAWQVTHGHTKDRASRLSLEGLALVSIVFLAVVWSVTDLQTGLIYAGGLALCGVAVTIIIASASHPHEMVVSKALSFRPLRGLGLISYGLYLYHWPIYLYLNEDRTGLSSWALLGLQSFVAIDVAVLSYFLVEKPIRYGALGGRKAWVALPAGAALACVALLVGTVGAVPAITTNTSTVLARSSASAPTVLLTGDSVPYVLGREGILPLRKELGVSLVNAGQIGCTPLASKGTIYSVHGDIVSVLKKDCTQRDPALVAKFHPDVAVVLYGALDNWTVGLDGKPRGQCDPIFEAASERTIEEEVDHLSAGGAPVVLVTKPGSTDKGIQKQFDIPDSMARSACDNEVLRRIVAKDKRTRLVDLASFICPNDQCIENVNGVGMRRDGQHFRFESAQYVARWLIPRVLAAARTNR